MASAIDICNLALAQLGDSATVTAIDPPDGSNQAGNCSKFYPLALRKLMEEYDWSFLQTRAKLNLLNNIDMNLYAWKYAYALPSDCVRVTKVSKQKKENSWCPIDPEVAFNFEVEYSKTTDNKILLTDVEDAIVQYTVYKNAPAIFPTYFIEALVLLLASYLVGPLKRTDSASTMATNLRQAYEQALSRAKTADAQTSTRKKFLQISRQQQARWV